MKYLSLILISLFFLSGCKTTEKIIYEEKEIFVPKVIVEYCDVDLIDKCKKYINNNEDLIKCYIHNESKIDEANEIIKMCLNKKNGAKND